jgi:Polyketide cyclase / dehydrase and lipid transport
MFDFTIETEIERTPAEVFAYVIDATKLATWQTNTVSAVPETDGPLRVGSRIREVHRAPGGKKIEELVEVDEYEPDRVLGVRNILVGWHSGVRGRPECRTVSGIAERNCPRMGLEVHASSCRIAGRALLLFQATSPSSVARWVASARERQSSLVRMLRTCMSTVRGLR